MIYGQYAQEKVCSAEKYSIFVIRDIMHWSWQFSFVRDYIFCKKKQISTFGKWYLFYHRICNKSLKQREFLFQELLKFHFLQTPTPNQNQNKNPQTCFGNLLCSRYYAVFSLKNHLQSELIALYSPITFFLSLFGVGITWGNGD